MTTSLRWVGCSLAALALVACLPSMPAATQSPVAELTESIAAHVDRPDVDPDWLTPGRREELRALYQRAAFNPRWVDLFGRPTSAANDAFGLLDRALEEGLDPADYYRATLARMATVLDDEPNRTADDVARFDVTLSAAILRYLHDLHQGRVDPDAMRYRLSTPPSDSARDDFATWLDGAIADDRIAELAASLRPPFEQYRALQAQLIRYRALVSDTPSVEIVPPSRGVRPGESWDGLEKVHARLLALGDLPAGTPFVASTTYEGALVDGVKRFQVRHGLEADGVLGAQTVTALNVPLTRRVRQIEFGLERLRWLPQIEGSRLLVVNIPMFRLWAWDSPPPDQPAFSTDVIVGRAVGTETPIFASQMREVIFRPYWNIPASILRHEVLPLIERRAGYLDRENMEIVRGERDDAELVAPTSENIARLRSGGSGLRVRQRPGPKNALGLVKFVFPNETNIYMHGTPALALFNRSRRDFSHGCIRVRDPVGLAEWVLKGQDEWDRERIVASMGDTDSRHVKLTRPIRVILFYSTAMVMPDGSLQFADDIYGHDARLDRALAVARTTR